MKVKHRLAAIGVAVLAGGALAFSELALGATAQATRPVTVQVKPRHSSDPPYAINVTASPYNAACDGSTDDTMAIQHAINAAPSTGAVIQIPHTGHVCKITSTITLGDNDTLEGEGGGNQIWFASDDNGPAIQFGPTSAGSPTDERGGGIRDIGIIGETSTGSLPNQIGIQVSSTVNAMLSDVTVTDTGIALQVNGGGTGDWDGEGTYVNFMSSNVVTGIKFTNSGGTETDQHVIGGYENGVSTSSGYGIYAAGLHTSVFEGYSAERFGDGVYLTTNTQDSEFFGDRVEQSGPENGTASFVCDGSGVNSVFWGPHDSDMATTAVTNLNSASCTSHF